MSGSIRIGLVEDHEALALGMSVILAAEPGLELVATAKSVDEFLAKNAPVDLVVLGLRLADGSNPQENIARLRESGVGVLVSTGVEDPFLERSAHRAVALGVLRTREPAARVVAAIRAAASGQHAGGIGIGIGAGERAGDVALSPRQIEILKLYASGEKAEKVARMVGLSPQTVSDYLQRIRQKYANAGRPAHTKTDLYKRALEDGLLPIPQRALAV